MKNIEKEEEELN